MWCTLYNPVDWAISRKLICREKEIYRSGRQLQRGWHDLENANSELRRVISALHCDREPLWEFQLKLALIIINSINIILIIIISRRRCKFNIATKKDFGNFGSSQLWCGCKGTRFATNNTVRNILRRKCLTPHSHVSLDIYDRLKARRWDLGQTTFFETHWEENVSHLTHISGLIFTIVSKQEDGIWD